jgi:hypothetical protein
MLLELVAQNFPKLKRLAKKQVRAIEQPELFQQVILRLFKVQNTEEAQDVLLSLDERDRDENEQ